MLRQVTLDRKQLIGLAKRLDSKYITLGLDLNDIDNDTLDWVSNAKHGNERILIKIG